MEHTTHDNLEQHLASSITSAEPEVDRFTPELIAARLRAFEEWQALLSKGNSTSGRNGRPWREWIHEDDDR